jgi:hypothetical protein
MSKTDKNEMAVALLEGQSEGGDLTPEQLWYPSLSNNISLVKCSILTTSRISLQKALRSASACINTGQSMVALKVLLRSSRHISK